MTTDPERYLGCIEYSGKQVASGMMDAKTSANALLGLDRAIRYFVVKQCPELEGVHFQIPVRIGKGSWQALIPETIGSWVIAGFGVATAAYVTSAAKKMAEKYFKDVGLIDLFKKAVKGMQWLARIGKHIGNVRQKTFHKVVWRKDNTEIGLLDAHGEYLYVPKEFLEWYAGCPTYLLSQMASVIEDERKLRIIVYENNEIDAVDIAVKDRAIFCTADEKDTDVLFPELAHGQQVEIDGIVTRGNENSNSIGFKYDDHILTCYPREGSIVRYKHALFLRSRISGKISREDDRGGTSEKRPKIIFDNLVPLEPDQGTLQLFEQ